MTLCVICLARFFPIPVILDKQFSFSSEIISNALLPSFLTIYLAVFLPHPFTIGDERNARTCSSVCGIGLSQLSTFNCLPNLGCVSHPPLTVICSFLSTP